MESIPKGEGEKRIKEEEEEDILMESIPKWNGEKRIKEEEEEDILMESIPKWDGEKKIKEEEEEDILMESIPKWDGEKKIESARPEKRKGKKINPVIEGTRPNPRVREVSLSIIHFSELTSTGSNSTSSDTRIHLHRMQDSQG